jgi:predicted TPR repeat methyltransferase
VNAAIGPGTAAVLEIGCGTGQLTRQLAGRALNLTAIDIGAAIVEAARRNIADATARFQMASFEDFADSGPFDLIVSATRSTGSIPVSAWPRPPGCCGPEAGWRC